MKPKTASNKTQISFLYPDLMDQLNPKDPLLMLAKKFPWEKFEREFAALYGTRGRPAKPVRLMVGLLLLKQIENLSDERVVEVWTRNPYYQAFCGEKKFQWKMPCDPSDLVYFRKRIGESGAEKILQASVQLHGQDALEREVVIDTTVQEKNITFPTDTKLRVKAILRCQKLAACEGITLRRSYRRELRSVLRTLRFTKSVRDKKAVRAAARRVKTIANVLLREIRRKLPQERLMVHQQELALYHKAVNQERNEKDKVYSLHEPDTCCISKGKAHKKYEFGSKAAIAMTKTHCILVGARNFSRNEYDGNTLAPVLCQIEKICGQAPEKAFCDRGFRGRKQVGATTIVLPSPPSPKATEYAKRKARKDFGRRSAIEPVISHMKRDFRMAHNYLKGVAGDAINLLLAACAFNCCKWMRTAAARLFFTLFTYCIVLRWQRSNICQIRA